MDFKVGDVVILKSGSDLMTIEEIIDNGASCVWFDKNKKVCRDHFPFEVIAKYLPRI